MDDADSWIALAIGNSRLHWARFEGDRLRQTWESPHADLSLPSRLPVELTGDRDESCPLPLAIASVVPAQTHYWLTYPGAVALDRDRIPLKGLYSTLGIDRALAVLGLGTIAGFPCLAIDGGTALTLTGVDGTRSLVGGAILPGLGLQARSLAVGTAALPDLSFSEFADALPRRWAKETAGAIASGIFYTILAGLADFIADWLKNFPGSAIAFTGGDGSVLYRAIAERHPEWTGLLRLEPHLIFTGMQVARSLA